VIALLRGKVAHKGVDSAVIDVNGVGYLVALPLPLLGRLQPGPEEHTLHVATIVREDGIFLFGFSSPAEREAFDVLRGVEGIGPRLALACLSASSVEAISKAVAADDVTSLCRIPGVGKKIASRMCLELKGKLQEVAVFVPTTPVAEADPLPLALARLEYRKSEIDLVLASADVPRLGEAPLEKRLQAALRVLARPSRASAD
jgi:holliday junction DNA helicase RuvA